MNTKENSVSKNLQINYDNIIARSAYSLRRLLQIGLFVRPVSVRKVITFWGREMSVPDGHTSPVKIKVRISVFEKSSQKLGLAFCRSLLRDPVLELESDLFRNSEINVLT